MPNWLKSREEIEAMPAWKPLDVNNYAGGVEEISSEFLVKHIEKLDATINRSRYERGNAQFLEDDIPSLQVLRIDHDQLLEQVRDSLEKNSDVFTYDSLLEFIKDVEVYETYCNSLKRYKRDVHEMKVRGSGWEIEDVVSSIYYGEFFP